MKKKYLIATVVIVVLLIASYFVYTHLAGPDTMQRNPRDHLSGENCTPAPGIMCPASTK